MNVSTRSSLRRSPVKEATTRSSRRCQTNTSQMICIILSIAIGAAGLLFINIYNQQGYYLRRSFRKSFAINTTDTIRLASSDETKDIIQLRTPKQSSVAVGRDDGEEQQLEAAIAVFEKTGTSHIQSCASSIYSLRYTRSRSLCTQAQPKHHLVSVV
jgi:hypothetical protein